MRTFLSINPDSNIQKQIGDVQQLVKEQIASLNVDFTKSIKWEPVDKLHMTLFFIGDIDDGKSRDIDTAMKLLSGSLAFHEIEFKSTCVNAFPKLRFPRVIILEFENLDSRVKELSEKINHGLDKLGFVSDKPFKPHITLGRVRRDHKLNLTELRDKINLSINFSVSKFCLMKSTLKSAGSEYAVTKEYVFGV